MGIRRKIKILYDIIGKKNSTGICICRPWKTVLMHQLFAVKPWIAAENFVSTFSGQCYLVLFFYE